MERRASASAPRWRSARAPWIARWSACTSRRSANRRPRLQSAPCALVTGLPFKDTQCGFKLFETSAGREVFSRQQLDGFGFDVEVLFIASKLGFKSVEVPVRWDNVEGTKVSLLLRRRRPSWTR